MNYFVDVILPIPIQNLFTYGINREEAKFLKPGMRIAVPFGKSKIYTSIVYQVHATPPTGYDTKEIYQILDETPIVTPKQLEHWQWIASYYACTLGEVVRAALSKSFLLESETVVLLNKEIEVNETELPEDERLIYEALKIQGSITIHEISNILDKVSVLPIVHRMVEKNLVLIEEEIIEQYKPKLVRYVKLHRQFLPEEKLKQLLETLSKAPKQKKVLLTYFSINSKAKNPVKFQELQKESDVSPSVIKSLINKEILEEYSLQTDRVVYDGSAPQTIKKLSEAQEKAYNSIRETFEEKAVTLLHGVTASGKTEIYVKVIDHIIRQGKQVLYMLPEIALTTQLISRLQNYFGEKISVYHSRYSANERVEVWYNVLHNKPKAQIVIGARSAQFLPFADLGLIIVDEEHEASFKQYNPAPRYHARDSAIVLAHLHKAKTLLGSATPSVETYFNAKEGKYGLVSLSKRFGNVKMPVITLVNIKESHYKKQMTGHFSETLLEEIRHTLDAGEQIILFQNRRGFSPIVECQTCGNAPQCPNCDVSLTYHQHRNQLRCHYCGYTMANPVACIACGSPDLDHKGLGTEQIETELKALFPDRNIARMDQDTTKGKHAYAKLIEALEQGETDILVGTQMVAKGLDFRNVGLVGVMNADSLFNFPDFRAHERSFQMLLQVAGRAGRTEKQGKVIIQTYNPQHPILQQVMAYDYETMYKNQLEERKVYKYPPYYRLIKITLKNKRYETIQIASQWLEKALRKVFEENVLGPEPPPVGRIKNEYLMHLLIKIPKQQSLPKTKEVLLKIQKSFFAIKEFRNVKMVVDVDNY